MLAAVKNEGPLLTNSYEDGKEIIENIVSLDCFIKASIQDLWECTALEELENIFNTARTKVMDLKKLIQTLHTVAMEEDDLNSKTELEEAATFYKEQLESTQIALRKAALTGKQKLDAVSKQNLLNQKNSSDSTRHRKNVSSKENVSNTAKNITHNLLSISRSMHNCVNQSADTLNTLISSSKTVTSTSEDLKDQHGHIKTSHNLLTKYGRREITDKFLIFLALVLFFSTVLYILKKRLYPG